MGYIEIIKESFAFFPFVAFILTIPYLIHNYHKYGSVFSIRVLIIYSFVLYLMTVYFLIILPLPEIEEVAALTTQRIQLIPFNWVIDLIKEITKTGKPIYLCNALFQILFNILMTVPFGMYLHYYFKFNLKKTMIASLLLSLFFELTQLSGLYFIYPRSYRLCDVDDLMANTLGGVIGYFLVVPVMKILPDRDLIDKQAKKLGKNVSVLKKLTALGIDIVIVGIADTILAFIFSIISENGFQFLFITYSFYFVIIPIALKGRTIGQKIVHIKSVGLDGNYRFTQTIIHFITDYFILVGIIPVLSTIVNFIFMNFVDNRYRLIAKAMILFICIGLFIVEAILYISNKGTIGERLAKSKIISTIEE